MLEWPVFQPLIRCISINQSLLHFCFSDRLLVMLMQLMTEHWALIEPVLALEALLDEHSILAADAVESYRPAAEQDSDWDQQSFAFIQSVVNAAQNVDRKHRGPKK